MRMSRLLRRVSVGALIVGGSWAVVVPAASASVVPAAPVVQHAAAAAMAGPSMPLPTHSGAGRRIVYSRSHQHVWLVDASGVVVLQAPTSGRLDWPRPGTYHVHSKSPASWSTRYHVRFRYMVRFAFGHHAWVGFHTIPVYADGRLMQPVSALGRPVGKGGCPHLATPVARYLYRWAHLGTTVVVLH